MSSLYPQVYDGEWVQPVRRGYRLQCCDCCLIHVINFRLKKHGKGFLIQLQAFRDDRATARQRKRQKVKVKRGQ